MSRSVDHTFLGFPFLTDVSLYSMLMNVVWNSGRELFLADASLFVDDAEAFDHYEREEQEISSSQPSTPHEEVLNVCRCRKPFNYCCNSY